MPAEVVVCPQCRARLKLNGVKPGGVEILCPQCKHPIKVPAEVKATPAVAGSVPSASVPVKANGAIPEDSILASTPQPRGGGSMAARLGMVVFAGLMVIGLGSALVVWCFSGRGENGPTTPTPGGPETSVPVKRGPPAGIATLSKDELRQLAGMKRKGIDFLKKTQRADGAWPSKFWDKHLAAMGGLTLLESGVPASDPAIQKAATHVRQHLDLPEGFQTYGMGLYLLFLDRLNDPQDRDRIKHLALRLMTGQTVNGAWTYDVGALRTDEEKELDALLREVGPGPWKKFAAAQPQRAQKVSPGLRNLAIFNVKESLPAEFYKTGGDNSNTQFALLALWAARRHKLPVDLPLQLVVHRFRASQEADGHWIYGLQSPDSPGAAMTCAGLLACAMGHGMESGSKTVNPLSDPAIRNGLAYLGQHIGEPIADAKTKPGDVKMYALWSVERVGMLFGQSRIGGKDWYRWGFTVLRALQKEDGSWNTEENDQLTSDTCFALLFLHQVNLTKDLTDKFEVLEELQATESKK